MPRGTGMAKTRRRKVNKPQRDDRGGHLRAFLHNRLARPDTRSHAEYLRDMRAQQAAGQLTNPATAALLDRLSNALSRHTY